MRADLAWRWKHFDELGVHELQNIYMARQNVFVVEQRCAFLDADGHDERAFHLAAWLPGQREPLAYARVLEPGVKYAEPSIGRVATTGAARGTGLGREAVRRAIAQVHAGWPGMAVRISAQSRLVSFYASFGFASIGASYMEDDIAHTDMLLAPRPA